MTDITLVTGLWDINRSELSQGWNRSFKDHYIKKFTELLKVPYNLIVFGEKELESVVFKHRNPENTQFIERKQEWFKNEFYDKIQSIRTNPDWYNQVGWLKESTQAKLEMYNPLVMSKMFLLNDATVLSKFNTSNFYWIDAGITSTVNVGYFTKDRVLDKLSNFGSKLHYLCFPYNTTTEIHGFTYPDINSYADNEVKKVARAGFFGGSKESINTCNEIYYQLLSQTLNDGYMGTEESIFSIMVYKYPNLISHTMIEENGLIYKFFEDLKNDIFNRIDNLSNNIPLDLSKVGLYVLGYNSPNQFKTLCESMEIYDSDFINVPKKFLLNNSTDRSTDKEYDELCKKYNFTQIKKDNIGICGGRQFIAEHFDKDTDLDFYFFFEDDMFFYNGRVNNCINGFIRKIDKLYRKSINIVYENSLDFLKLNFTEFFGDNRKQWSWFNLPSDKKKSLFPDNPFKGNVSAINAPNVRYELIDAHQSLPYALGDVYYCNWPQVVSRQGNKKMFLDTKWENPYEQTWMSHIFQETINKKIKPAILLASPTEHNRFDHYPKEERREN